MIFNKFVHWVTLITIQFWMRSLNVYIFHGSLMDPNIMYCTKYSNTRHWAHSSQSWRSASVFKVVDSEAITVLLKEQCQGSYRKDMRNPKLDPNNRNQQGRQGNWKQGMWKKCYRVSAAGQISQLWMVVTHFCLIMPPNAWYPGCFSLT